MIVSTTLIGPDTLDQLDEALESVRGVVDLVLLIPTDDAISDSDCKHAARRAGFGAHFAVERFSWVDDFSAARNFALAASTQIAAGNAPSWAITLDTDERLSLPSDLREQLAATKTDLFLVAQADGSYAKERIFRIGKGFRWVGATHEAMPWVDGATRETLAGATFRELPKTPEQLKAKFERDRQILERVITESLSRDAPQPERARPWFYLGESLDGLGETDKAVAAFLACATASTWDEEAAWAHYRAAALFCRVGRYAESIATAAKGLALHAGIAELAWIAAVSSYRLGRYAQAVHWALMAVPAGMYQGTSTGREPAFARSGFRHPPALWEGPFDVLAHAYERLGMHDQAARAAAKMRSAELLRTQGSKPLPPVDDE